MDNQQAICLTDKDCQSIYSPIIFCKGGLTKYFKQSFNNPDYASNVLAHDFGHFIQCMDYAQRHFGDRSHAHHVLKIFTHKLRSAPYVDAQAYVTMLDALYPIMNHYENISKEMTNISLKTSLNDLLYDSFINQFNQFKENPAIFFDTVSDTIIANLDNEQCCEDDISDHELKKALSKFLTIGLSKLIWRPASGISTFHCTQSIAHQLHSMSKKNFFDSDDFYDLTDELFERYLYFLDLCSLELPSSFFCEIKYISEQRSPLFDVEELEHCFETRRQKFARALLEFEFKAQAYQQGLCVS